MSSLSKFVTGTVDSCPFAPRSKMIISEGLGLALGAGASVLGSALGFGSSQSAYSTYFHYKPAET